VGRGRDNWTSGQNRSELTVGLQNSYILIIIEHGQTKQRKTF